MRNFVTNRDFYHCKKWLEKRLTYNAILVSNEEIGEFNQLSTPDELFLYAQTKLNEKDLQAMYAAARKRHSRRSTPARKKRYSVDINHEAHFTASFRAKESGLTIQEWVELAILNADKTGLKNP